MRLTTYQIAGLLCVASVFPVAARDLDAYGKACVDIGFSKGTPAYGNCVLELDRRASLAEQLTKPPIPSTGAITPPASAPQKKPAQPSQREIDEAVAIAASKKEAADREAALQEQQRLENQRREQQRLAEEQRQREYKATLQPGLGRAVSGPYTEIKIVSVPEVYYPREALEEVQEGLVTIKVCIDESDAIKSISIAEESVFSLLNDEAIRRARGSTFKAATQGGNAIASCAMWRFRFELRSISGSEYSPARLSADQFARGVAYYTGQGPTHMKDMSKAVAYFRLALEKGNADAQFILGLMHQNGEGLARDQPEAAKLYQLAALQGHRNGQKALGFMFANGEGVPKDLVQAYMWFYLAASQGDSEAKAKRTILEKMLTPEQLKTAKLTITEAQQKISTPMLRRPQLYTSRE